MGRGKRIIKGDRGKRGDAKSDRMERRRDQRRRLTDARRLKRLHELPDDYKDKTNLVVKYEEGAQRPPDSAFARDGRIFLPNRETGSVRWTELNSVKEGYSELNNNWVHRKGDKIQAQHRYLEDPKAIEDDWRRRTNAPIVDTFGRTVTMDKTQLRKEVEANKKLNGWMESYLKNGESLDSARQKTQKRALDELKVTLAPLAGLSPTFTVM